MEFFEVWIKYSKNDRIEQLFRFISEKHDLSGITEYSTKEMKAVISRFSAKLSEKWEKASRMKDRFLQRNAEWLSGEDVAFKVSLCLEEPSTSSMRPPGPGRPSIDLVNASAKTKRRRVDDLVKSRSSEELMVAAEISARLSGQRTVAKVIKDVSESPEKAGIFVKSSQQKEQQSRCLTSDEAFAYYVDSKSSSHSYKQTRKWSLMAGHKVFPSFYSLRKAKLACYPPEEQVVVTETRAEIKLQAILDKTAQRLISAQREVINACSPSGGSSFVLISKWGCDGSSGHSTYKQKFTGNSSDDCTDEYLFVFSFVPLQLRDESGNIAWQNPRPSSTMYCRPLKFIFSKENTELTVSETNKVSEEINELMPTLYSCDGYEVSLKHELLLTMVDGKVCNALTETSSAQRCYICGATPKLMNDESKDFMANKDNFGFGLSTLHALIRCFECLLHISYRLDVKKWQIRDANEKTLVN